MCLKTDAPHDRDIEKQKRFCEADQPAVSSSAERESVEAGRIADAVDGRPGRAGLTPAPWWREFSSGAGSDR